ncbi:MAG: hypothetical protein JST80_06990 [Bdellovibrionales bacterium]|nr:hypothetical protein [Bdellovibrionales bacterium]
MGGYLIRSRLALTVCGFALWISACTGGQGSAPQNGGILLQTGSKLTIDLTDIADLGQLETAQISLKSASPNFTTSNLLLDLTDIIRTDVNGTHQHNIVLPKAIQDQRPLLIAVNMPDLGSQIVDIVYDSDSYVKPGIASSLAYELIKYYPGNLLTDYDAKKFGGIKSLIQSRVDQLIGESEQLSLNSVRYDRIMNYFMNGLAFNIPFLTAIKDYGIDYGWTPITPSGLQASDTPENSTVNYQYASAFTVNGSAAPFNPFNHSNNASRLMPGSASINPSTNIFVLEGKSISLSVQAFDIDDDFIDKNFIVQYLPRTLPSVLANSTVIPEPTPEYQVITNLSTPEGTDVYNSNKIAYNEALDLQYYNVDGDTAFRNVYYLISDGMVRIPYRWAFKYVDVNRQPKILVNNNKINDTSLDNALAGSEPESPTGWRQHASHCETDSNATYNDGSGNSVTYQPIHSRSDGPWSCVFKVIDPDLDEDPNAAPDQFSYAVTQIDSFTEVKANNDNIWPPLAPYTLANPKKALGTTLPTCTDANGIIHRSCGLALYQITIDNAVKVAAEQKSDLMFNYDAIVYDRPQNGLSTQRTLSRTVQFLPVPPRIVNFSSPTPGPTTASLDQIDVDGVGNRTYSRFDAYLSDIFFRADPGQTVASITDIGFDNNLTGASNRTAFMQGSAIPLSDYITQPHNLNGTYVTFDPITSAAIDGGAGNIQLLGHSMKPYDASTYKEPREYDSTCNLADNNYSATENWDQRKPSSPLQAAQTGGWTFEIDAIDFDNVGLRPGEPTDRIFFKFSTDIATSTFSTQGLFEYCRFTNPNTDILSYQTYNAVGPLAAVDPDLCAWDPSPPIEMQPIPVYYKVVDAGVTKVKKLVYHRIRMKWRPKDQGLTGKSALDPAGYIRNLLNNFTLNGNRYANNGETLDIVKLNAPIAIVAKRKDMQPCLSGTAGLTQIIHQLSQSPNAGYFNVLDENKTLMMYPYYSGALMGRMEAELKLMGTRSITDPEILKWLPYSDNCTTRDLADVSGPAPTPPPTISNSEPIILYSRSSDATDTARLRLVSATNPIPPTTGGGNFCYRNHFKPLTVSGKTYNSVIIIENLNTTSNYTVSLDPNCFSRSSLDFNPDIKYVAIASRCTGYTINQSLWSDSNSIGTVKYIMDPAALGFTGVALVDTTFKLFPSLYQVDTSSDPNSNNTLMWELNPLDTFVYNSSTGYPEYQGYGTWVPSDAVNLGPTPAPGTPTNPNVLTQYVDWDNGGPSTPLYLSIATPTPDPSTSDVFFRPVPGDSTRIQVFSKNHATATFPFMTSDVANTTMLELDPFDIHTFVLGAPSASVPTTPPVFSGVGRAGCTSAPPSYPAIATLDYNSLKTYHQCQFSWVPASSGADDGKRFSYAFTAQDNFGASTGVMGVGGRHPSGLSTTGIPSDNLSVANGPQSTFYIDMESIENNIAPFFTSTLNGSTITMPYNSSGGAAGWTTVYSGSSGVQPTCPSAQTGFPCSLSVANGDTLSSSTSTNLVEGVTTTINIYGKDNNKTLQLKSLSATRPTQVLIVDGPHQGRSMNVTTFSTMSWNVTPVTSNGTVTVSFSWTPTDAEANLLSNLGGFLIPITITDQTYAAASDPGFPSQFVVPSLKNTIWIWAKINVKNNTPTVFLVNSSNVETPLNGATVQFQSGTAAYYRVRIKDTDLARVQLSGEVTGFNPAISLPPFVTPSPAGTPYLSGNYIIQDMYWGGTASNSDLGTYTSPSLTVTDPGDPTLGLGINPDAGSPPRAKISSGGNSFSVPFNIQVIGKPMFLVPNMTQNQVFAYSSQPFYYPLALSISRPVEIGQAMFIGIDNATTVTPVKRSASGLGLYVSEKNVLEWLNPLFTDITNPADRVLPLYGIRASYCNAATPTKILIRYNKSTNTIEQCKISAADVTNNLSMLQNLSITLVNGGSIPSVPSIIASNVTRYYTPTPTPAATSQALNQQFADFKGRCGALCNYAPVTSNAAPSGLDLNPSGSIGYADYTNNGYKATFNYDTTSGFTVTKTYSDTTPSTVRTIVAPVFKGERVTFTATLGATPTSPYPNYRWYVNGCLRDAGSLTTPTASLSLLIKNDMNGLNNDCTGQYNFSENNAGALGKIVVRLAIVNGSETISSASDGATNYYIWNNDVINSDPSLQTDTTIAKSAPIKFNTSSYYTGTQPSKFGFPVSYSGKSFFAYTDYAGAAVGLKIRLREINSDGSLSASTNSMDLNCASNFESQPVWMGIQPQANGKLLVVASTVTNPYPTGGSANLVYGMSSKTCYRNDFTTATTTQNYLNLGGASSVPAGYLAFSKYLQSSTSTAYYTNTASIYKDGTNESNYFFVAGTSSTAQHWTYSPQPMYSSTPTEFLAPNINNIVRKTIIDGSNMFQLIGASANNQNGWQGAILISSVSPNSGTTTRLDATITNRVAFKSISPGVTDCAFDGTPLDGVYDSSSDSLFVLSASNDGTNLGHFIQIRNATTSPTCTNIADVLNPSLDSNDYNPNITKTVLDNSRGLIYGIINQVSGSSNQLYIFDIYTKKMVTRDISSSIVPYEVTYSPEMNALYIYDNRRTGSIYPTLYRVW